MTPLVFVPELNELRIPEGCYHLLKDLAGSVGSLPLY